MPLTELQRLKNSLPLETNTSCVGGNIGGCVISKTPFDLGPTGVMKFTEDTQPVLTDEELNFNEYRELSQENREVINLG